ncbi:MAG: peptidoglycan-binding domain-containing protein [Tetrasphaera sp.]
MAGQRWATIAVPLAVVLGAGLGWSGRELFTNPPAAQEGPGFSLIDVTEGTVGRSFNLGAAVAWSGGTAFPGAAAGTVTAVAAKNGVDVDPGDRLSDVDLTPVVVASGRVPSFRDLQIGVRGADVRQLQDMLRQLGFRTSPATGTFDTTTANQV